MKRYFSLGIILSLTILQGLFSALYKPTWGDLSDNSIKLSVQQADRASLLFLVCGDLNNQASKLIETATPAKRFDSSFDHSCGNLPADVIVMRHSYSLVLTAQTFNSFGFWSFLPCVPSRLMDGIRYGQGFVWLLLILFLCLTVKFCTYLPRSGIDSLLSVKNIFENPHWLKINEGFSFDTNNSAGRVPC